MVGLCLVTLSSIAISAETELTWTAPTLNEDGTPYVDPSHYTVLVGCQQSGQYEEQTIDNIPHGVTSLTVTALPEGGMCYFVATATNLQNETSVYSGEATRSFGNVPGAVTNLEITWQESSLVADLVIEAGDTTYDNGDNSNSTTHLLSIPAYASGDLVIVIIPYIASGSGATSTTFPAGTNAEAFTMVVNSAGPGTSFSGYAYSAIGWYKGVGAASATDATFTTAANTRGTLESIVVPAGEWDEANPISTAVSTDNATTGSGTMPAFSANSDDAGGKLMVAYTLDTDTPSSTAPTGYTAFIEQDAGRTSHVLYGRDTAVTASESIAAMSPAGSQNDSWVLYGFIVRPAAGGGGLSIPVAYHHQRMLTR